MWVNSNGKRNMPSGEVFTGPHEDSAEGGSATRPVEPARGGGRGDRAALRGRPVVDASAERGQEYLRETLATDEGASRLGEIGIGTNFGIDRPMGMILLRREDRRDRPPRGRRLLPGDRRHNSSAVHWDMICDLRQGGRLTADGEAILEDGRFT